ncbi:MAG: ABC transporter permease [Puniceicoccales bacterium]|jgi:lipoprotein-releasing system permease protein|nr:ABC transporter permease [Puniceicoccales bacterium]
MNWSTYLAYKSLFPSRRKFTFFTAMSIVGVMLGVAVLVVVQSVMNGFQSHIRGDMVRIQGEIRIEGKNIIEKPEIFEQKLKTVSEIESIAPYTCGVVMMICDERPVFPVAKGVDLEAECHVTDIDGMLRGCSLENLQKNEIIMGEALAKHLGVELGDFVEIYTPLALEALRKDTIIFPRDVRVVGYFSANNYDRNAILCSLPLMQELYELDEGVHGFTVKLVKGQSVEQIAKQLEHFLGEEYEVMDWIHGNSEMLFALRWEKTMMFFVLLFILLVASFSISSTLIANVISKTREIGLIMAMGGSRCAIAKCFCLQGFFIGLCGTLLGLGGGVTVLHFRDSIIKFITWAFQWEGTRDYLSQFIQLPVEYHGSDFLLISLFSTCICIASGIIPGLRASRICPADALRYEQ